MQLTRSMLNLLGVPAGSRSQQPLSHVHLSLSAPLRQSTGWWLPWLLAANLVQGQFVAFNDHAPGTVGVTTHTNATTWNIMGKAPGRTGALKEIRTGATLTAVVTITTNGPLSAASTGANPAANTPLSDLFKGYVDFQGAGNSDAVVQIYTNTAVTYTFTGLNTNRTFRFIGSAVRGGVGGNYAQRWSLFQIDGAHTFTSAHTVGGYTNGLANNQVAINTGINTNGDYAGWESIAPDTNGSFSVTTRQYVGAIPGGGTANGPYAYAFSGFRLVEDNPPLASLVRSLDANTVQVVFSIPVDRASATNSGQYTLTNAAGSIAICNAILAPDGRTLQITTASQEPFARHWLSLGRIADAATGLSYVAPDLQVTFTNIPFTSGYALRQLYLSVSNTTVASLTNSTKFPNSPDQVIYTTNMGWPQTNIADNYGGRLSALVSPPVSGNYYFAIRSDDNSQLFFSTNDSAGAKTLIAAEPKNNSAFDAHSAGPFSLIAGQHYYLEALMKEGTGSDYLYVAWKMPTNMTWTVIPGQFLGNYLDSPYGGVIIQRHPTNQVVMAGQPASFAVAAIGSSSITTNVTYQWQLNGFDIPGANTATLTLPSVRPSNSGDNYRVLVAVPGKGLFSSNAVLTVTPDTLPPKVTRAYSLGQTNVQLLFSEPLEVTTAADRANYSLNNGLTVTGAALDATGTNVLLTTSPLVFGSNYTVSLQGVRDLAANTISANAEIGFQALPFVPEGIGGPAPTADPTVVTNGLNLTAYGTAIGNLADQCHFSYQTRTGDFDVAVRVAGLSLSDIWAQAGLMARESLHPSSRFAATLATPTLAGAYFQSRDPAYSTAVSAGSFPVNYPETWLRLKRAGNVFTGFAGYDGKAWEPISSATISLPSQVYLGLALSSHNTNQAVTGQFREFVEVLNAQALVHGSPRELLGPSSRKTPIIFSEIMYKPAPRDDGRNLEYIEIYNSNPFFYDLSGSRIVASDLEYTFPTGSVLGGGAYLVVAAVPADIQDVYGITNVVGPYAGSLKKADTLKLVDEVGAVRLSVPYSSQPPWPVGADGAGCSLVLANPTYGEADPRAWDISDRVGGSPGALDSFHPDPLRNVVINEFLAHTDPPDYDYIELYNHSTQSVAIAGCILTDHAGTNRFVIPPGTILPPRGFLRFAETDLGFGLSAAGETLYFFDPARTCLLDAVTFGAQENGVATGRWPDGAAQFYRLAAPTPGLSNAAIRVGNIVINELMYHPISNEDDDQYVELYNQGTDAVDLGGWKLSDAVQFTFPNNTVLAPNAYLVVARSRARLLTRYSNLNSGNTLGDFSGKLSAAGERLALTMPDTITSTNTDGTLATNHIDIVVDEVTYSTGGRWGQWADGGGSSLELINPRANHRLAANWGDSDETHKAAWTNIETVAVLDNGKNYDSGILCAQLGLLDVGECLVDNIEVHPGSAATNYVMNPDFESGLTNWWLQGCFLRSSLENEGYSSARSLHVRGSSRFWTGANSCEVALYPNSLGQGQTATLRFKARWLRGWPEVLLRLNGNWLEAVGRLPVPPNLGTPGAPNSRYLANAGPAIYEVAHDPPLPSSGQSAMVTARVHDPDGVQSLTLYYRVDPAKSYTSVAMKDDGTGTDAVAGDGLFSAAIPGQTVNKIVAFYLAAKDSLGVTNRFPALATDNSLPRECLVMFGASRPGNTFGTYHLWVSQTNATRWANASDLSNESWDCTMVNNSRIIYNLQARFAGSPYHQSFTTPTGNLCHYKWTFPEDDKFLGATSFNKIHQPGNGPGDDLSIQREQTAHTFLRALGVPWLNRRYVAVFVNGNRRGTLMEDAQCPDADVVEEYWPDDSHGWMYKMQPWFEFAAKGNTSLRENESWCNLMPYTTTGGVKKVARYRYNFEIRRTPYSANDFTNVFSLIDAAGSYGSVNYAANMQNLADMENWMRVFAANHAAGNWDSYGAQNGQNLYGYMGTQGTKYSLLMWDFNIVLGNSGSWGPGENLFAVNSQDSNTSHIYNDPTFRRMYLRALQELVEGPLDVTRTGPLLDAKYNAFVASGQSVEATSAIKNWLTQARSSITTQIASQNPGAFTVGSRSLVNNTLVIYGTAPVRVKTLRFNGVEWPVKWQSVTTWRVVIPLQSGTNTFDVVGVDLKGQPVAGATNTFSIVSSTAAPSPEGQVVINEIMYHPILANAEYVELFNRTTTTTFDLSGWELRGLAYTFPPGSLLAPASYLVLAANRAAFAAAYGATIPVFDVFDGGLQTDGETLTLAAPNADTNAVSECVVSKVRYGTSPPWPTGADGTGSSLQLIDPAEDNWRLGNWSGSYPPASRSPGTMNKVYADLPPFPSLWLNEVQADNLTGITNSQGQRTAWVELYNPSTNLLLLDGLCLANTYTNLAAWTFPTGNVINPGQFLVIFADGQTNLTTPNELHTSFTLASGAGTVVLSRWFNSQLQVLDYLPYTNLPSNRSYGSSPDGQSFSRQEFFYPTAGQTNNGSSAPLTVTINEWMAANTHTLTNPIGGKFGDWFELYNCGANPADLHGYFLTDSLTNKFKFQIPPGYVIPPGGFLLVWADEKTATGGGDLHVNFKMSKGGESLGLYGQDGQPIDYVIYGPQEEDVSLGRYPDGADQIVPMLSPTPRTNNLVPNTPPDFASIPDQWITLGQSVILTASATDVDQPPQTLSFHLGAGTPAGAAIDSASGLFSWRPMAVATNRVHLVVRDDGNPSLSTTQSFSVLVFPPPALGTGVSDQNQFTFTFQTLPGQQYQLEFNEDLVGGTWTALGPPVVGTGEPVTITNDLTLSSQRYYRLQLLPF